MAARVIDRGPGTRPTRKQLANLGKWQILVGVIARNQAESDLVTYAAANEFGVPGPTKNGKRWRVPPRSFLRSTVREKRRVYARLMRDAVSRAVGRREEDVEREFGLIGVRAVRDVQLKITQLRIPPNAPSTIRRKGSSNPLIDTGRLRQSITYELRETNDSIRARRIGKAH